MRRLVASKISPVGSCKDGEGTKSARLAEEVKPHDTIRPRGAHPGQDDAEEEVADEELRRERRQLLSCRRGGSSAERGRVRTSCSAMMKPAVSLPSLSTTPPRVCFIVESSVAEPGSGESTGESSGVGRIGLRRLGVQVRRAT